jgi:hypothetical protein
MSAYNVKKNPYHKNPKISDIETPPKLANYLAGLWGNIEESVILDTSIGSGNLLEPFLYKKIPPDNRLNIYPLLKNNVTSIGIDVKNQHPPCDIYINKNFLEVTSNDIFSRVDKVDIVIQNPPFNRDKYMIDYLKSIKKGNALIPELFIDHIFSLFGKEVKVMSFVPIGLLANQRIGSTRWIKFLDGTYPPVTNIVSLPIDTFPGIQNQQEVLFWNTDFEPFHQYPPLDVFSDTTRSSQ